MDKQDVKAIAKALAEEIHRSRSFVVDAGDIAIMCGYAKGSHPVREILADPTFPPSVSLVEGGYKKYRRSDVEDWINARFDAQGKCALATHPAFSR